MRQLFLLTALFICVLAVPSCTHSVIEAPAKNDTLFFLMAGQSNMAGRGIVAPEDTQVNPRLLEMDTDQRFILKQEPNKGYQGGLAGLDCGLSFGNELLPQLPQHTRLGLIQCAIGSTSIQEWLGDSLHVVRLYSNMLSRARKAMQSGKLKGVLWMQGETNADDAQSAIAYDASLSLFIQNLRRDAGIGSLPFYICILPAWCKKPFKDSINLAIRRTAASVPEIYLIPTDDLGRKDDSVHLDAAGQRALGKRFAGVAVKIL